MGNAWYEDKVDLGFKIKTPKDWEFVPASPLERNMIGRYAAPNGQYVNLGREEFVLVTMYLVKFDARPKEESGTTIQDGNKTIEISMEGAPDIDAWMDGGIDEGNSWERLEAAKPLKGAGFEGTFAIYEGKSTRGRGEDPQPVHAYVADFKVSKDVHVSVVGLGPGDKKWRNYEKAYETIAKSIQRLEVAGAATAVSGDPRGAKRAKLQNEVAKSPGWALYETPNYFIVSSYNDKQFIEEMKTRLEGIRAVYEQHYPPATARRIKVEMDPDEGEPGETPAEPETKPAEPAPEEHTTAPTILDPMELSRTSVVRVCKDREEYMRYGGSPSTGGYWNWVEQELVIYDDKNNQGTAYTWGVLNHEAFHQYIFYFYGNLSPHSWYNEGTGDYYFGFEYKNGKYKEGPSRERQHTLVDLIGSNRYVPLRDFVKWSKSQYYGNNTGNGRGGGRVEGYEAYAQGWSLIWFLRTGAGKAKGWQKSWETILPKYLDTLLDTGSTKKAVEAAYADVDWDAFEASWLDYTH